MLAVASGGASGLIPGESLLLLVLIRLLGKLSTPNLFSRFQALSADLFLQGVFGGSDPRDSELCLILSGIEFRFCRQPSCRPGNRPTSHLVG